MPALESAPTGALPVCSYSPPQAVPVPQNKQRDSHAYFHVDGHGGGSEKGGLVTVPVTTKERQVARPTTCLVKAGPAVPTWCESGPGVGSLPKMGPSGSISHR